MINLIKKQSPARIIALGFAALILLGSLLLMLPCSVKDGVTLNYIDSLYTAASAVCVTGLVTVDTGNTFTALGQFIIAILIQAGGLGVTTIGAGIMLAIGKKVNFKGRTLIKDATNNTSLQGIIKLVYRIFTVTVIFELLGAILSFIVFSKDYPVIDAIGISIFHSVSAFNNAGFDILGNFQSLIRYQDNILLNFVTCGLIFFGGIGFIVVREIWAKRFHWKKFSMHTKVVLTTSAVLIIVGTILIKLTENVSLMGAFFHSVSARTAGFSTYSLDAFSRSGLMVIAALMLIGASPCSTGGGIKTTTFFVLVQGIFASATNTSEKGFHYAIPKYMFKKASIIILLALGIVMTGTYIMSILEPQFDLMSIFFEMMSAFGTVGLSLGITSELSMGSKILLICIMYIGRLGPLTVATLWHFSKGERVQYAEGNIRVG